MKLTAERDALLGAIERARRVTPSAKEATTSSRARLTAAKDQLSIYGTDLTVFVASRLPATVLRPGEIGIVPADLAEMIRRMPDGAAITLDASEGRMGVSAAGSKRTFRMPYVETADMPAPRGISPAQSNVTIAGDVLAAHVKRVLAAAYQQGDRPNMCGVGFDGRDMFLRLAATNGQRVAVSDVEGVAGDGSATVRLLHLAGARALAAEATEMGDVGIVVDERGFSFASQSIDVFVPHIGAEFPDYEFVFSSVKTHTSVVVTVREMSAAVNAMSAVSKATKLSLDKSGVRLHAHDANDQAEDEVEGIVLGKGGVVYLSTPLLLDALKGCPNTTCDLAIGDDPQPVLITSGGTRSLIMPLSPSAMGGER